MRNLALLISSAILLSACGAGEEKAANTEVIRSVKTVEALATPLRIPRYFPATLEPPELVPLAFEVTGRVADIDLRVGQRVSKGERLGTIEPVNLDLQLQQAKASVQEAKTAMENARLDAERYKKLFSRGAGSAASRDSAVAKYNQAKARVKQAEASVDLLSESRNDAELTAPFDGFINSVDVQDFASVQAGQPVLTLYREGDLQATILTSFKVVEKLNVGDTVTVLPSEDIAKPLESQISEIGQRATAVSSFPVVVNLNNATEMLRPGMAVEVQLYIEPEQSPGQIALPLSAISTHNSGPFNGTPPYHASIFVFEEDEDDIGTLRARDIEVMAASGHQLYVGSGLEPGEIVAVAGVPFLRDGQKVKLYKNGLEEGAAQ